MTIVVIVCCLFVLQIILSFIQVTYYKRHIQKVINQYAGCTDHNLYSAMKRKRLGRGAIALIVVYSAKMVKECQVLAGFSVFSKFTTVEQFKDQGLSKVLSDLTQTQLLQKLTVIEATVFKTVNNANV